jgi:hypothetical protein
MVVMAYLVGTAVGHRVLPRTGLGWSVHGEAQGYELILSSSTYSCTVAVAVAPARYADPLLRRFDALFAVLVKQGSSSGAGDPHGLRYTTQDGPEGVQDAAPGGFHDTRATSSTHSPSWSNPRRCRRQRRYVREKPARLACVAWLGSHLHVSIA